MGSFDFLLPDSRSAIRDQNDPAARRAREQAFAMAQQRALDEASVAAKYRADKAGSAPAATLPTSSAYASWAAQFPGQQGVARYEGPSYTPPPPSSHYDAGPAQAGDNDWIAAKSLSTPAAPAAATHTQWDPKPVKLPGGVSYGAVSPASSGELKRRGLPASSGTAQPFGEPWKG